MRHTRAGAAAANAGALEPEKVLAFFGPLGTVGNGGFYQASRLRPGWNVATTCTNSWTCIWQNMQLWPRWPSAFDMHAGDVFVVQTRRSSRPVDASALVRIEYGVQPGQRAEAFLLAWTTLMLPTIPTTVFLLTEDFNAGGDLFGVHAAGALRRAQVG